MTKEFPLTPSVQDIHKPMQLWKGYTKQLDILSVPTKSNKWI